MAISYIGTITMAPTYEQVFGEKRTYGKFQIDISETEGQVTYMQTDSVHHADHLHMYMYTL